MKTQISDLTSTSQFVESKANKMKQEVVEMLYGNLNTNLSASVIAATILFAFAWLVNPGADQLVWLFCIYTVSLFRFIGNIYFKNTDNKLEDINYWHNVFLIGAFSSGAVWGIGGAYFADTDSITNSIVILFLFAGLLTASVVSHAASFPVFLSFAIPLSLPMVIVFIMKGTLEITIIALLAVLYTTMMYSYAKKLNTSIIKMFELKKENKELILNLELEKEEIKSLNNELESRVAKRTNELNESNKKLKEEYFRVEKIEKNLNEKKALFKNIFEYSPIGMGLGNLKGDALEVNKTLCDIVGFNEEELVGKNFRDFLHMDEKEGALKQHMQLIRGEVESYQAEKRYKHKNGEYVWVRVIVSVVNDENDYPSYLIAQIEDISSTKRMNEQLVYQANHDLLTGLTNRYAFEQKLKRLIDNSSDSLEHVLCYLDLDQFKLINDTCGHDAGDALLEQLSQVLTENARDTDTVSRLGGDEFGLLLENCTIEEAVRVAEKTRKVIEEHQFIWKKSTQKVGVSIGLVSIAHSNSFAELLKAADAACYAAKDMGRNRVHVFNSSDDFLLKRLDEMEWITEINKALDEERLFLVKQSIKSSDINSSKEKIEILLRMEDVNGDVVLPGKFLPAVERYSAAMKLDKWVVETTFKTLRSDTRMFENISMCSINLSGQSIGDENFLYFVDKMIVQYPNIIHKICFEITETAVINNFSNALHFIHYFKSKGCYFALDDFGSGLSSYAYLKTLPVDYIKIDGLFIRDIVEEETDFAMVKSINEIAHMMQKKTIAEFVESEEILKTLTDMKIDYLQGYAVGKPVPFSKARQLKIVSSNTAESA